MVGQLDHCSRASKDSGRFMSSLNPTLCKRRTVAGYHSLPPPKDSARRVPWAVSPRSGETQAGGTLYGFPLFSATQHCVRSLYAHLVRVFQPPGPWSTCMGFVFFAPITDICPGTSRPHPPRPPKHHRPLGTKYFKCQRLWETSYSNHHMTPRINLVFCACVCFLYASSRGHFHC